MQLAIHTTETAPEVAKPILDGIARDLGRIPNMAATAASSPALLSAFDSLRRAVGSGELDPVVREVAGLAVGVAVDNQYGVAFHSTVLAGLGVEDAEIERMRGGEAPQTQSSPPRTTSHGGSSSTAARSTTTQSTSRPQPATAPPRSSRSSPSARSRASSG